MSPGDRKYSTEHQWGKPEGNEVVVGITDYAQNQLGDVVYVELPRVGEHVEQMKVFGVIESAKTASDLYAPVSGEVVEVNQRVVDEPTLDSPYASGWLIKIRPESPQALQDELSNLLDAEAYAKQVES